MLIKGIISELNLGENKCTVRLPTFEVAGGSPIYVKATFAIPPGTYNGYSTQDVVIVGFEGERLNRPIILGKLYTGPASESPDKGDISCNSLSVSNIATIPGNTKLLFPDDLLQNYSKYKSITDIIDAINATSKAEAGGGTAAETSTDVSHFETVLGPTDTDVQKALDTLDKHTHPATDISVEPLGNIQAINVEAALYELDDEKLQKSQVPGA